MSIVNPSTPSAPPSGTPFAHGGNGSLGAGGPSSPGVGSTGTSAGPTATATLPGPETPAGGRGWRRSEFGAFLDDLSDLAKGAGGSAQAELRGEIERRISQARDQMGQAIDQGVEMSHRTRERVQRGIDYSRDTVSERPLASLMVAAVGGLIVGLLMSRRD